MNEALERQGWTNDVRTYLLISILLCVIVLLSFWGLQNAEFINLDDWGYVFRNASVMDGLSVKGIQWAFTTTHMNNWQPVTWISHMLDCSLFGVAPGAHHVVNIALHAVNSILVFVVLLQLTGSCLKSSFVAAVFAVHPLHVESVAWISERRDVLSTLFGLLTLLAYARFIRRPSPLWYGVALVSFVLGLLSKPMLVTLPFVLLLLDFWPAGRIAGWRDLGRRILEKVPFFMLSAASCVVTYVFQEQSGAMAVAQPLDLRIANAFVSYVLYVGKSFVPINLAIKYPYPASIPLAYTLGSALLLGLVTTVAVWLAKTRPYLAVGWFWFLGTLFPVIGLVKVGTQAMADRYMYVPLIGLLIATAWGFPPLVKRIPYRKALMPMSALLCIVSLAYLTRIQVGYWHDSVALYEHTAAVTNDNIFAHYNLGLFYREMGDWKKSIRNFEEVIRIDPMIYDVHFKLAPVLEQDGRPHEAVAMYESCLRKDPRHGMCHYELGRLLFRLKRIDTAIEHMETAAVLRPSDGRIRGDLSELRQMKLTQDQ
jgi:hypothetical protein